MIGGNGKFHLVKQVAREQVNSTDFHYEFYLDLAAIFLFQIAPLLEINYLVLKGCRIGLPYRNRFKTLSFNKNNYN